MDIREYLADRRRLFDSNLVSFLTDRRKYPEVLCQAMEYSLFAGGKRLRPILTLTAAEACGGEALQAMAPAVAVEMIHTYSLIHDDLPAMDDDDLRRGKPTSHRVFGEGMAILAGDALLTHAFSVLAEAQIDNAQIIALVRELAEAAGPRGMVAGQALDISAQRVTEAQLKYIHACKTGALIKAAVRMGAIVANADTAVIDGLTRYASALGQAFQIVDDILDVTETSQKLGKNPGSDGRKDKQTYITLYGLEEAKNLAAAETKNAVRALADLQGDFSLLRELALYLGRRHS